MSNKVRRPPDAAEIPPAVTAGQRFPVRYLLIFCITLLWCGIFSLLGLDLHHDGAMFMPAVIIARGGAVFRDAFAQYGLLMPLLQGGLLKLFGSELIVLKLGTALLYAVTAVLLDRLFRDFLSAGRRYFLWVLFLCFCPDAMVTCHIWSSVPALLLMTASTLWLTGALKEPDRKKIFLAGLAAGVTFTLRHPCGIVLAAAGIFTLLLAGTAGTPEERKFYRKTLVNAYLPGMLAVPAAGAIYITACGAWHDYCRQCWGFVLEFVYKRGGSGSWGQFSRSLFPIVDDTYWFFNSIFALAPLMTLGMWLKSLFLFKNEPDKRRELLPLLAILWTALGAWHQYYPVPCIRHLFWGGILMFGVMLCQLQQWRREKRYAAMILPVLIIGSCLVVRPISFSNRLFYFARRQRLDLPGIRGMLLTRGEAVMLRQLQLDLAGLPPELQKRGVMNWSEAGLLTRLLPDCGFRHPMIYRCDDVYPDYREKVLNFIEKQRPAVFTDLTAPLPSYALYRQYRINMQDYYLLVPLEAMP